MSDYIITNRQDTKEMKNLVAFILSLVIKDDKEANQNENLEMTKLSYAYIQLFVDAADDVERQAVLDKYATLETNPYYVELRDNHKVSPLLARMNKNYSILTYDDILGKKESALFVDYYYQCYRYYLSVLYNKAFESEPYYSNFSKLFIVVMAMQRYITARMELITDIDFFDEWAVRNMFASFKLDVFQDLPLKYQKRILKNLNTLIKYKGTNKVIIDIVSLFGFEDVTLFKYYLLKKYKKVGGEYDLKTPDLVFAGAKYDDLKTPDNIKENQHFDFDSFIVNDPYWYAKKEDILKCNFNYIMTKYIGIESVQELLQETMSTSYLLNVLHEIEVKYPENTLKFFSGEISQSSVRVIDALVALQVMLVTTYELEGVVPYKVTQIGKVYNYNFQPLYNLAPKILNSLAVEVGYEKAVELGVVKPETNQLDKNGFLDLFSRNHKYRTMIEKIITETNDYETYKCVQKLWDAQFTAEFNVELFHGHTDYREWLKERDPYLYDYVYPDNLEPDEFIPTVKGRIISLCTVIEQYLDSDEIDFLLKNNSLVMDFIKEYIIRLLNIFKSYTVQVKNLETIYRFQSKVFGSFRLFDKGILEVDIPVAELFALEDSLKKWYVKRDFLDTIMDKLEDKLVINSTMSFDEKFELTDKLDIKDIDIKVGELVELEEFLFQTNSRAFKESLLEKVTEKIIIGKKFYLQETYNVDDYIFTYVKQVTADMVTVGDKAMIESIRFMYENLSLDDSQLQKTIEAKLMSMLEFLEKLSLENQKLGSDIIPVNDGGQINNDRLVYDEVPMSDSLKVTVLTL